MCGAGPQTGRARKAHAILTTWTSAMDPSLEGLLRLGFARVKSRTCQVMPCPNRTRTTWHGTTRPTWQPWQTTRFLPASLAFWLVMHLPTLPWSLLPRCQMPRLYECCKDQAEYNVKDVELCQQVGFVSQASLEQSGVRPRTSTTWLWSLAHVRQRMG